MTTPTLPSLWMRSVDENAPNCTQRTISSLGVWNRNPPMSCDLHRKPLSKSIDSSSQSYHWYSTLLAVGEK